MAMTSNHIPFVTVDEYLDFETDAERHGGRRSEYVNGRIRPMTESGVSHICIQSNLVGLLIVALREHRFKTIGPEIPLRISADGPYYYPEVVIAPRPLESHRGWDDSLLNPVSVFEIDYPSTETIERDEKLERKEKLENYARINCLRDYVAIAQDGVEIDHFWREGGGEWNRTIHNNLSEAVSLKGVDVSLSVAKIYDRVSFDPSDHAETSE